MQISNSPNCFFAVPFWNFKHQISSEHPLCIVSIFFPSLQVFLPWIRCLAPIHAFPTNSPPDRLTWHLLFFFFQWLLFPYVVLPYLPPSMWRGVHIFFKILEVIYPDIAWKTDGIIFFYLSPLSPWPFPCLFYVSTFAWLVGNCLFLHGIWTKCCCWKLGVFRHSDDLKLWWAFAVLTHTVPAANSFLL